MASQRKRNIMESEVSEDFFHSPKRKKKSRRKDDGEGGILKLDSLFGEVVTKAGYIFKSGDQPNLLNCDQAVFQRHLAYTLKSHPLYELPEIAEKFVKGLGDHAEDPLNLKWCLLYTQTEKDCETARGGQQDSLIRLCLNIEELQPCLIQFLMGKLVEIGNDDESRSEANIPGLILANLKWMDYVIDSDTLTTRILEIIEVSPLKMRQEVITFVPNIINDANHPRMAEVLCDLYNSTRELTPAILDTLGCLSLPKESLAEVHHSVLKSLNEARPEHLHVVIKFLLSNTDRSISYQILGDIRENIKLPGDCEPTQQSPKKFVSRCAQPSVKDDPAYEILLLNNIKMTTLANKFLATNWLKVIQDVSDVASVKPIDFLILLILYDSAPSQRHTVEGIFRNKTRTRFFSDTVLEKIFANHAIALRENFEPLKKIASLLMRSQEPHVSHVGATLHRLCFLYLDGHQRQETVLALLNHLADTPAVRKITLDLLSILAHEHTAAMSKFTIFLKGSMDIMDELSMREVKRLMDVVSLLVFSDASHAALQDELMILVRKQLSHTNSKYKHIGVLNAALIMKNMVENEESEDGSMTTTSDETSILNTSGLKDAENLLCLVMSSTSKSPTAAALFMDELASISLKEKMNNKLEEWICDKVMNEFQSDFIIEYKENTDFPQDLFNLSASWDIDSEREEGGIALNLAPLVIKAEAMRLDSTDRKTKLVYLTPQFRLLRMLESRLQNGSLANIDALLGCPVISPAPEVFEKFDSLSMAEQHTALSCLFYTINWFRELINAFVTQKDPDLKKRVYKRLRQVIEVQNMISQYLPKCPSYVPPIAVFDLDTSATNFTISTIKKKKKGRKVKLGKEKDKKIKGKKSSLEATHPGTQPSSLPTSQLPLSMATQSQAEKESEGKEDAVSTTVDMASLRPFLRELHTDVFLLLFRKLSLDTDMKNEGVLSLPEAEFLLTDLNIKLEHIFVTSNKRAAHMGNSLEKSIGHSHLDLFSPAEVVQHIKQIIKPLCVHLESLSTFFHTLIADDDIEVGAPNVMLEHAEPMIKVNSLLFTALHGLLSWRGLQEECNKEILRSILRIIAKKLEGDVVSQLGQEELTSSVFRYISNFHGTIVDIGTATLLVQTLVAITALPEFHNSSNTSMDVLEELLSREWYTSKGEREKGPIFHRHLHTLLQQYLKQSKNSLNQIEKLCQEGLGQFMNDKSKDPHSITFPTLNKNSLLVYYKVMMCFLVSGTKKSLKNVSESSGDNERLMIWRTSLKIFSTLVTVLKEYNSRHMLSTCLKFARHFVDLFLHSGMPLMDTCLRQYNKDVLTLLRSLQGSTRFLQHICTHSKVKQVTNLTSYVPPLRKSLETLVYRVKAMLAHNNCHNAFWMGTLKNRDIYGDEILSQSSRTEAENEEDKEDEDEYSDEQSDTEIQEEENENQPPNRENQDKTRYSSSF